MVEAVWPLHEEDPNNKRSRIGSRSETLLGRSCHATAEYWTGDRMVDNVERIHDALDPRLVDL